MNGDKGYTLPDRKDVKDLYKAICPCCRESLDMIVYESGGMDLRETRKEKHLSRGDLEHIADDYRNKCVLQFSDFERLIAEIKRSWAIMHEVEQLTLGELLAFERKVHETITGKRS